MKKFILLAITAIALLGTASSCTKTKVAEYGLDLSNLSYVTEYKSEADNFTTELQNVLNSFNNTEFTDSQITNSIQTVVNKYNNKHIFGTFDLTKKETGSTIQTIVHTFTMTKGN